MVSLVRLPRPAAGVTSPRGMRACSRRRMAARHGPYVRRSSSPSASPLSRCCSCSRYGRRSHMLLLIFGGILLAVLLRGARRDCSAATPAFRKRWPLWIVVAALARAARLRRLVSLGGDRRASSTSSGESLTALWDELRGQLEQYGWGQQVLVDARRSADVGRERRAPSAEVSTARPRAASPGS